MGTNPALRGNQPAAAQGHGFAQGLAALHSEAGRWADKGPGCSSVVGQLPMSAHQAEHHLPAARQWSRLSQCLSWDHVEGHMHSLFRPQWEALPLCWPGSCH